MTTDHIIPQLNGEWLCNEGAYRNVVQSLISSDPRLRQRDPKAVKQKTSWPSRHTRIVQLELDASEKFRQTGYWTEPKDFGTYLATQNATNTAERSVILVEGLSPDLISILGTHFNIHPSFFVDHERVVVFNSDPSHCSDSPALPSCSKWGTRNPGVTLKYFEVLNLSTAPSNFYLSCADSGRHIGVNRIRGKISSSVVARRKCSIWPVSRSRAGYTCIIICDPPLRKVRTKDRPEASERPILPVRTTPYDGGYRDFMDSETQMAMMKGPPQSSMLDDLQHYLITHGSTVPSRNDLKTATAFVEMVIASHYLSLTSFMASTLSSQQWDLSRQQDMGRFSISMVEQQWSDIQSWERRLNEYCSDIDDIMIKLGIEFQEPNSSEIQSSALFSTRTDFQFLRMKLQGLRHQAEQINAATSGLASIAGNRQAHQEQQLSLRETQRTKALTLVGLIFVPLAYTATLFSMNEHYMPGATHFWIYFSVSVPLIAAVILTYSVLDKAYDASARSNLLKLDLVRSWTWTKPATDERDKLENV